MRNSLFWLSDEHSARIEPHTTIYNRFARWAERVIWENPFNLLESDDQQTHR
jgi:hypothetical protein